MNSVTKTFDLWVKMRSGEKAVALAYHPGTVRTGLSKEFWANGKVKEEKLFEPERAVGYMWDVVRKLGVEGRGRCWDWRGVEILP